MYGLYVYGAMYITRESGLLPNYGQLFACGFKAGLHLQKEYPMFIPRFYNVNVNSHS